MNPGRFTGHNDHVTENPPPRGNRGRARAQNFRRSKGRETADAYDAELRKRLFVGTSDEEETLARLHENQTLKAITLTIMTRAIGFVP